MIRRANPRILILFTILTLLLYVLRTPLHNIYVIIRTPIIWSRDSPSFTLSLAHDDFDVTFANYSATIDSASPYPDLVPPVLHHIALGPRDHERASWREARDACVEMHPGWEAMLWTDENAETFVREKYPLFKKTWDEYRFPIQRIDALRYMVLYEYGGVVLDMDLKCTRSLGPLRRFGFVAPAAHPMGFSIGFMMAEKRHQFVGELLKNLPSYNQWWFGLPYPSVMFSTGCHYASAIHTLQPDRSPLKILSGPSSNPRLHSLNGDVVTPLFHHLGSSSWHSFDAALIVQLGRPAFWLRILYMFSFAVMVVLVAVVVVLRFYVADSIQGEKDTGVRLPLYRRMFTRSWNKDADMFDGRVA